MAKKTNTGDPIADRVAVGVKATLTPKRMAARSRQISDQVARRQANEAEGLVAVVVLGNGPVSHCGVIYYENESFSLRSSLADPLLSSGRVALDEP